MKTTFWYHYYLLACRMLKRQPKCQLFANASALVYIGQFRSQLIEDHCLDQCLDMNNI